MAATACTRCALEALQRTRLAADERAGLSEPRARLDRRRRPAVIGRGDPSRHDTTRRSACREPADRLAQRPRRQQLPIAEAATAVDHDDLAVARQPIVLQAVVRQNDPRAALDRTLRRCHAIRTGDDDRACAFRQQHRLVADFLGRRVAAHVTRPLRRIAAIAAQDDADDARLALAACDREPDRERSLAGAADGDIADHDHRPRDAHAPQRDRSDTPRDGKRRRSRTARRAAAAANESHCASRSYQTRCRNESAEALTRRTASDARRRSGRRAPAARRACRVSTMRPASRTRMRSACSTVDKPMRDDERRAVVHQLLQRILDEALGLGVERGGRFVEDQDRRILQQRARDRDALPLSAREQHAAIAHHACRGPAGRLCANSITCAARGRVLDRGRPARRARSAMLLRMVSLKSTTSWLTSAICSRRLVSWYSRTSWPSMRTEPSLTS